jgi:OFA family oxalate/formate antiporter-like MFS transporter
VVTFAGTAVNLCLGILYAWSVWKNPLTGDPNSPDKAPGVGMTGLNTGWVYLTHFEATVAYAVCGFVFALVMIPGGRLQDRYGPKLGATLGGLSLAGGCVLAGLMKSYLGLVLGFGVLGGVGMGLGYAAATPAAVKWFGPHRRGLIVGLVVGGYGGAAIYISPLARWLMTSYGLTGSFVGLGLLFGVVVVAAGQLLTGPPPGYSPPPPPTGTETKAGPAANDRPPSGMIRTWQFYALVFVFIGSAQSGLLVIANATKLLDATAGAGTFFAANAWLLASFGGFVNAVGRVGTGLYSDRIGRANAFLVNGLVAACCLFVTPWVMATHNVALLFVVVGVTYWQYGGGLALLPALTADYFGPKNLGFNYGLVFLGWGVAFFLPQFAGYIEDATRTLDPAFYVSGVVLVVAVVVSRFLRRPGRLRLRLSFRETRSSRNDRRGTTTASSPAGIQSAGTCWRRCRW